MIDAWKREVFEIINVEGKGCVLSLKVQGAKTLQNRVKIYNLKI